MHFYVQVDGKLLQDFNSEEVEGFVLSYEKGYEIEKNVVHATGYLSFGVSLARIGVELCMVRW